MSPNIEKKQLVLKKGEERRLRSGHLWVYSNEVDTKKTPLPSADTILVDILDYAGRFLGSASFNPNALICARILSDQPLQQIDIDFITTRLQQALALRELFFPEPYYRLVFSEGDLLPGLIIDRFNKVFVIQTSTQLMDQSLPAIQQALIFLFGQDIHIQVKNDGKGRNIERLPAYTNDYPAVEHCDKALHVDHLDVTENGVRFKIPPDGQKTGWFYDHRPGRNWVNHIATDKTVLDLFSYMGGWGLQAVAHGAKSVTCVDISQQAGDYIQRNAQLNQTENKVSFIQADVFDWLKQPVSEQYDIVIADPPALIPKRKDYAQGRQAYFMLNEQALQRVKNGGVFVSASCSSHLPKEELLKIVEQAAGRLKYKVQLLHQTQAGPDHPVLGAMPETAYLKALMFRVLKPSE